MARRREETDVQSQMIVVLKALGYLVYHTYDSRRCEPGFPDLWIVGYGKLLVLELKAGRNTTTADQSRWLAELKAAGIDARVYHVDEWKSRMIVSELRAIAVAWKKAQRRISR